LGEGTKKERKEEDEKDGARTSIMDVELVGVHLLDTNGDGTADTILSEL